MEPQEVPAVDHVRRGVHVSEKSGMILDEKARMPSLEDGKEYKFLGVLESVTQEDKLVLECTAKEYLRRMDKSFVRLQSCDRFKPVCLAGAWLPHVSDYSSKMADTFLNSPASRKKNLSYRNMLHFIIGQNKEYV